MLGDLIQGVATIVGISKQLDLFHLLVMFREYTINSQFNSIQSLIFKAGRQKISKPFKPVCCNCN